MSDTAEITIPDRTMTLEEFLGWAETVPKEAGRFELWDGRVIVKKGPAGSITAGCAKHWEMTFALPWHFATPSGPQASMPSDLRPFLPPLRRRVLG